MFKILFLIFSLSLYPQNKTQNKKNVTQTKQKSTQSINNPTQAQKSTLPKIDKSSQENTASKEIKTKKTQMKYYESLDKKYYDYYFETLPDKKKSQQEKLRQVLYKSFKKEIYKIKKKFSEETWKKITPETIKYEKVDLEGIWWRGIKKQLRHIMPTNYVYIVFYGKYYCLFTYVTDPSKFIQSPQQSQLIFKDI